MASARACRRLLLSWRGSLIPAYRQSLAGAGHVGAGGGGKGGGRECSGVGQLRSFAIRLLSSSTHSHASTWQHTGDRREMLRPPSKSSAASGGASATFASATAAASEEGRVPGFAATGARRPGVIALGQSQRNSSCASSLGHVDDNVNNGEEEEEEVVCAGNLELCGRGDKRTKRGKRFKGAYGKSRVKRGTKERSRQELFPTGVNPLPFGFSNQACAL